MWLASRLVLQKKKEEIFTWLNSTCPPASFVDSSVKMKNKRDTALMFK